MASLPALLIPLGARALPSDCSLCFVLGKRLSRERGELSGANRENLRYSNCCISGTNLMVLTLQGEQSVRRFQVSCSRRMLQNDLTMARLSFGNSMNEQ